MPLTVNQALQQAIEHQNHGRLAQAESLYRQILARIPNQPEVLHLLGLLRHQANDNTAAEQFIREALTLSPNDPRFQLTLGTILQARNQFDEAITHYRRCLTSNPSSPEFHHHLGIALTATGHFTDAASTLQTALRLSNNNPIIAGDLGITLCHLDQFDQAVALLITAIAQSPTADFHAALALALLRRNQLDPATTAAHQALSLNPNHPHAHHALSQIYTAQDRHIEADAEAKLAAEALPTVPEIQLTYGKCLEKLNRLDDAITIYTNALNYSPNSAPLHNNLANLLKNQSLLDDAIAHYRQAIAAAPTDYHYHSNLLFALHFHPHLTQEAIAREHHLFNERHAMNDEIRMTNDESNSNVRNSKSPHDNNDQNGDGTGGFEHSNMCHSDLIRHSSFEFRHSPNRRLRIGYIGMQFLTGYHLFSLIAHHDKSQFETFIYSNTPKPDAQTEQFRQHADHFLDVRHLTDDQLASQIRDDKIDILIDTSLHMGNNRILVFARKPAPIQISFFGYPAPTGLSAIDYRITDRHLEPAQENSKFKIRNSKEAQNSNVQMTTGISRRQTQTDTDRLELGTSSLEFDSNFEFRTSNFERPLCLPDTYWCYHPHVDLPVNPLPAASIGHITFGNLNNFCKINKPTLELWSKILLQVPRSRLIMMAHEGSHRDRTRHFFQQRNITPDRIDFVPFLPSEQYFATYHRIDICLDSFPYNGHTTSLDAFFMGVPVTTIIGNTPVSRATYSQLLNLTPPPDLLELAAATPDDFITITTTLATDLPRLAALRATLRQRMANSPLMDAPRYARNIEAIYHQAACKHAGY
ncbi:MAG: tetratricopeptide repeat protein [Phycisphaerales bacterium]|nr:tetratricopeptide repeat protein [Phycisphaerales bacterium]